MYEFRRDAKLWYCCGRFSLAADADTSSKESQKLMGMSRFGCNKERLPSEQASVRMNVRCDNHIASLRSGKSRG
jgi:hypothetical protein